MSENLVLDLSMQFAIDIVNLCESLKGKNVLTNQLLRSGTSIGANIHEANYASSKADFVAKMQIALEEGCNKYLDNCRARNLREGTSNHYRQSACIFASVFVRNS